MKKNTKKLIALAIAAFSGLSANAQYYDLANQIGNVIQPALSGSLNYKGFADVEYIQGIGNNRANFLNFSTSQGFRYNNWFYMGVGLGVDVVFAEANTPNSTSQTVSTAKCGVVIPLFSDFRFNVGTSNGQSPSMFFDIRLGGAFLMGNNYLAIGNGYLSNKEYFYLRPAIGVRIPINKQQPKQAVDLGVSYQLLTGSNYYYWGASGGNGLTLNGLGLNASFEW